MRRELTGTEYEQVLAYLQSLDIPGQQKQELADHLSVLTEVYLAEGQPFPAAFENAKKQISRKELLEIMHSASSFAGHPKFLNKRFLKVLASAAILVFITGLYLRYTHQPCHRLMIITGRRTFAFVLLPLLLLYNLTEYANKAKQVLLFVLQFALFQTLADYLVRHKLNWIFLATSAVATAVWLIVFCVIPAARKSKEAKSE